MMLDVPPFFGPAGRAEAPRPSEGERRERPQQKAQESPVAEPAILMTLQKVLWLFTGSVHLTVSLLSSVQH